MGLVDKQLVDAAPNPKDVRLPYTTQSVQREFDQSPLADCQEEQLFHANRNTRRSHYSLGSPFPCGLVGATEAPARLKPCPRYPTNRRRERGRWARVSAVGGRSRPVAIHVSSPPRSPGWEGWNRRTLWARRGPIPAGLRAAAYLMRLLRRGPMHSAEGRHAGATRELREELVQQRWRDYEKVRSAPRAFNGA